MPGVRARAQINDLIKSGRSEMQLHRLPAARTHTAHWLVILIRCIAIVDFYVNGFDSISMLIRMGRVGPGGDQAIDQ